MSSPSPHVLAFNHEILEKLEACAGARDDTFKEIKRRLGDGESWDTLSTFLETRNIITKGQKGLIDANYGKWLGTLCQGFHEAYCHLSGPRPPALRHLLLTGLGESAGVAHFTLPGLLVVVVLIPTSTIADGFGPYGKLTLQRDLGFIDRLRSLHDFLGDLMRGGGSSS